MPRTVQDVPKSELNFVIAMLKQDGAIEITEKQQHDRRWTVTGRFPGEAALAAVAAAPSPAAGAPRVQSRDTAIDTLARTLWGEARGEPRLGKEAVAAVMLNRLRRNAPGRFGATVEEVCRKPMQFSCWNPSDPNLAKLKQVDRSDVAFAECVSVAELAVDGRLADPTDGADHYHTVNVSPGWSQGRTPCCTIGRHHFFNNIP
jgi:spore germination cell wall hydrolase CwlJ-like protein